MRVIPVPSPNSACCLFPSCILSAFIPAFPACGLGGARRHLVQLRKLPLLKSLCGLQRGNSNNGLGSAGKDQLLLPLVCRGR